MADLRNKEQSVEEMVWGWPEKGGREGWVHGQEENSPGSIKRTKNEQWELLFEGMSQVTLKTVESDILFWELFTWSYKAGLWFISRAWANTY